MNIFNSIARASRRARTAWAAFALVLLALAVMTPSAWAEMPKAGDVIVNKATVNYVTSKNEPRSVESKEVTVKVLAVGAFTLDGYSTVTSTVFNTVKGVPGSTVTATHTLINTGNDEDEFVIKVEVDSGAKISEVQIENPSGATMCGPERKSKTVCETAQQKVSGSVKGSNGKFEFKVKYTIPEDADVLKAGATITVTPVKVDLYTAPNKSAADKDAIDISYSRFTVTKKIGGADTKAPDGKAWPTALSSGPKSSKSNCATSWTSSLQSSEGCQYTVYTLSFTNTGSAAKKFALSDALPPGLTYVAGSATWSESSSAALGDGSKGDPAGIDFQATSTRLNAVIESLPVNKPQSISFMVLVNNSATVGTGSTTNKANYSPAGADAATTADTIGTLAGQTDGIAFTVTQRLGVALGSATSATPADAVDSVAGTPNANPNDTAETPYFDGRDDATMQFALFNTGDTATEMTVEYETTNSFPTGTTFRLHDKNGTLLTLATGSSTRYVVSQQLAPGGRVEFSLKAHAPTNAVQLATPVPFSVKLTARAAGAAIVDAATGRVNRLKDVPDASLVANGKWNIRAGATIEATHTLSNNGTQSCGAYTTAVEFSEADKLAGWTAKLSVKENTGGAFVDVSGPVAAGPVSGKPHDLKVVVSAPANAAMGKIAVATLSVKFVDTDLCGAVSVTDTLTVIARSVVDIDKFQAADRSCTGTVPVRPSAEGRVQLELKPGECIVYAIYVTNNTVEDATNVSISDALPLMTRISAKQPAVQCESIGPSKSAMSGEAVKFKVKYAPDVGDAGTATCGSESNVLPKGGILKMTFAVKINDK